MTTRVLHLWQLLSPTLPIGAFAYSDGLEAACEAGLLGDADDTFRWLSDLMEAQLLTVDLPFVRALYEAAAEPDEETANQLAATLLARRETRELRDSDVHLGRSLRRLLPALQIDVDSLDWPARIPFARPFTHAAAHWRVGVSDTLRGYLWIWLESQVSAAVKLVPLGQTDGQRILFELSRAAEQRLGAAFTRDAGGPGHPTVALALLSCAHETQYSRLFRS
ncbi:MAG: urease accessory UreF family protein [Pseudomonadota bacterium]